MLDIGLLGTSGMMPLPDRFLTGLLLRLNGRLMLIDCGEGMQVTMKLMGWGFKALDTICFTHFHADHISGLPGLLLTIGNSGRIEPITLIGPSGLEQIVKGLLVIAPELPFQLNYIELNNKQEELTCGEYNISALALDHRVNCYGYSVFVKRAGKFLMSKAMENNVPKPLWSRLQKENSIEENGILYTPDMVLGQPRRGIKISYCTDTRPIEDIVEFVKNSDLYIGEGIYGDNEKIEKAIEHKHSTFLETAELAKKAQVKELWLTHYSPALTDPDAFVEQARKIFENTHTGFDRMSKTISFPQED